MLQHIALTSNVVLENAAPGTVIGTLLNTTAGVVPVLANNAGNKVALSGNNIVVGAAAIDRETTGPTFPIQFTQTDAGYGNSPVVTDLTIAVTNVNENNPAAFNFVDVTNATPNTNYVGSITLNIPGGIDTVTCTLSGSSSISFRNVTRGGSFDTVSFTGGHGDVIEVMIGTPSAFGATTNATLTAGTTSDTFSVTTVVPSGGDLTSYSATIARTSAAGSAPFKWKIVGLDLSKVAAGDYLELDCGTDITSPAVDANGYFVDRAYTPVIYMLTESDITSVAEDPAGTLVVDLVPYGFATLAGDMAVHVRFVRGLGGASPSYSLWSNVIVDTISAATTTWTTGGVAGNSAVDIDKAASIVVTTGASRTATGLNGRGVREGVRATRASPNAKNYTEFTVNNLGGGFLIGKDNRTADFDSAFGQWPGNLDSTGWSISFWNTGARAEFVVNSGGSGSNSNIGAFTSTLVNGDKIGVEHDTTTNKVRVFHIPQSTGVPYQIGGDLSCSAVGDRWFFMCSNNEGITFNPGQDPFARGLSAGFLAHA